jgi:hypothetical protein
MPRDPAPIEKARSIYVKFGCDWTFCQVAGRRSQAPLTAYRGIVGTMQRKELMTSFHSLVKVG